MASPQTSKLASAAEQSIWRRAASSSVEHREHSSSAAMQALRENIRRQQNLGTQTQGIPAFQPQIFWYLNLDILVPGCICREAHRMRT